MISSEQIVSKILSDLNIKEEAQRISDINEWIGEAIEKIGSVKQLERVVSGVDGAEYIQLKNHQAKMPHDLFRLNNALYSPSKNGPWVQMKLSTSSFNSWSEPVEQGAPSNRFVQDSVLIDAVKILYQKYAEDPIYAWFSKMDNEKALEILNTNNNVRTLLTNLIGDERLESNQFCRKSSEMIKYSIKPGYINTNVKSGYIKVSYDRLMSDENGHIMIPDNISYIEAVYWYVVMKLTYSDWRMGKVRDEIYYDARRSWNFYCKQAYAESMMPGASDMKNIKNIWNSMIPNMSDNYDIDDSIGDSNLYLNINK